MPQDPRHGEFGHRRSHLEQDAPANGNSPAPTGRRRRALSEDGTGGTRVIDLLSKHGKVPGGTTRRRAAEPELSQPQAAKPRHGARSPQATPAHERPEPVERPEQRWTAPDASPRRSRPAPPSRPGTPPNGWAPPANGSRAPQALAGEPAPHTRRRRPADGPANRPRPTPGGAAAAFAGGAAARTGVPRESGRHGAPAEPPTAFVGLPPDAARNGARHEPPAGNGVPQESPAAEPTRITQALSGDAAAPPRRAPRPARPVPPVDDDLEATTRHAPVRAPQAEKTSVVNRLQHNDRTTVAKPVPPVSDVEETAIVKAADVAEDELDERDDLDELDELDDELDDDPDDLDEDADDDRAAEIRQIDATLARFSAVHDEIAAEEAARRKKYAWLLGKRKEPELGTDMPFDFVEGRDGQSRMEWKKKQRKRRTNIIMMALAMAASLTVFLTLGIAWGATAFFGPPSIAALDPNSKSIKDVAKQTGDQNFLLVGSDTRAGATAADGVGSEEDEPGARSDTTIIAHIPADRSRVVLVSFPRDLEVDLPPCERWDSKTGEYTGEQLPARKHAKLNEAYATGGPLCTTKVIQQISGLRVDSFLGIDFQGFRSMVDAVHGVEVCTQKPIIDDVLGTVIPEAGRHTLTGEQALNYVRARHVQGDPTSDYGRMQRQQLFLSALLRKAMSSQVLLDPGKLSEFVRAVSANTFGENIGVDRLMDLGQQLQGLDANRVTFVTVPTTGYANERHNEVLREDDAKALFQAIIDGAPVTSGSSQAGQPSGGAAGGFGASGFRSQPAPSDPSQPTVPDNLATVNAGTDICG
ncbi:LCP family protein [Saccharopolyspora thermophila]|uniref:Cell envelope-related transcriptional attenuator domain-containing protein n=1 Tax=Saccharopolyspora thermophila TaxID=89367 RepID=A0ABN1BUL9_9PSEU